MYREISVVVKDYVGYIVIKCAMRAVFCGMRSAFFVPFYLIRGPPLINSNKNFGLIGGNKMENSPKRRKSKDNPYVINHNEINNTYIVIFNFNEKEEKINISKEIFDAFNSFELDDLKQMNERDRHYYYDEATDEYIYQKSEFKSDSVEEIVEKKIIKEKLQKAINSLSETQKRRIIKYYFEGKTEEEIAKEEGVSQQSVHIGIERAIEKLKEILKNLKI